jgi:hypothetical protein
VAAFPCLVYAFPVKAADEPQWSVQPLSVQPLDKCHGFKLYSMRLPQRHTPSPAQAPNDFVINISHHQPFSPQSACKVANSLLRTVSNNYGDVVGLSDTSDYRFGTRG